MTHIIRDTNSTQYGSSFSSIFTSKDRFVAPKVTFFIGEQPTCIHVSRKEAAYALRKFRKVHAKKIAEA